MVWIMLVFVLSLFATLYGSPMDIHVAEYSDLVHHIEKRTVEHQDMFLDEPCPRDSQLDPYQISFITNYHNSARLLAGSSNMNKLVWNDELACQAQRVADSCRWGHNDVRGTPGGKMIIGQNIVASVMKNSIDYMGSVQLADYMYLFYKEIEHVAYPSSGCLSSGECNHYRMMMIYKQTQIGAACNFCEIWENNKGMQNYTEENSHAAFCVFNFQYPLSGISGDKLYEKGSTCGKCAFDWFRCEDGLCVKCNEGDPGCSRSSECKDSSGKSTCDYIHSNGWCPHFESTCMRTCGKC